jgi:hypothetical protein
MPEGPSRKPRLDERAARERAARALGVEPDELAPGIERPWGWVFGFVEMRPGPGPTFVDGRTGLVTTTSSIEHERIALLSERGPMGVPPWSPPIEEDVPWWKAVLRVFFGR